MFQYDILKIQTYVCKLLQGRTKLKFDITRVAGLLTAWGYAKEKAEYYDAKVTGVAFNYSQNTERLFEAICAITEKKIGLINFKVTIDNALRKIPGKYSSVLKLFFRKRLELYEIAGITGTDYRTTKRQLINGLNALGAVLETGSYDSVQYINNYRAERLRISLRRILADTDTCWRKNTGKPGSVAEAAGILCRQ